METLSYDETKSEPQGTIRTILRLRLWTVLYSVLTASFMTFLSGISYGFSSPLLLELAQLQNPQFRFNNTLSEIFGALLLVGAMFGSFLGGYASDRWGRKAALILTSSFFLVGYFLIMCSYIALHHIVFKTLLLVGRFFTGIGTGWTYAVVPIYTGEVSPTELRSLLGVLPDALVTIGIFFIFALSSIPGIHYYDLALTAIAILPLFMFLVVWVPESPHWLLLNLKDKKRTTAVLRCLRGPRNKSSIDSELERIKSSLPPNEHSTCHKISMIFRNRSIFVPFLLISFLYIYRSWTGAAVVTFYAGQVFKNAGVSDPNGSSAYSIGGGLLVGILLTLVLVTVLGKKTLLIISASVIAAGCAMLGAGLYFTQPAFCSTTGNVNVSKQEVEDEEVGVCNPHLFPLALIGALLHSLGFALGLSSIPWILYTEYLPLKVRGVAGGITVMLHFISGIVLTGSFLSYSEWVGMHFAWWTLCAVNVVGLVGIAVFVVETRGKHLEEVEQFFKEKYKLCHWK